MNTKQLLFGSFFLGLFAGIMIAITGASITSSSETRWDGTVTSDSFTTQGGNITTAQLSSTQLTSKWTAFFGNVSGSIRLSASGTGNAVYNWSLSTPTGEICLSTNSSFAFTSPTNTSNVSIDAAFGTSGTPDNASATFGTICPSMTLSTGTLTNFAAADLQGSSTFFTCAMTQNVSGTNTSHAAQYAFCTNVSSVGTNYQGISANYELIAPANSSITYYFYMELS